MSSTVMQPAPKERFSIVPSGSCNVPQYLHKAPYAAALAFVRGDISVEGDLIAAIRYYQRQRHGALSHGLANFAAHLLHAPVVRWLRATFGSRADIQYHYDQSNEFYAQFLDRNMVYSCAYFHSNDDTLEQAQQAKLALICGKLQLQPGDRLLDIGCGWGALLCHAARHYGAIAAGCTLSHAQAEYARLSANGLAVSVQEKDYRHTRGRFDKIASIGMFEHVGGDLSGYFRRVRDLLEPGGLFLNHGIVRPEGIGTGAETLFVDRYVFPGSNLVPLSDVIGAAGQAGFEVLDVENLRPHYALTCREWVRRLQANRQTCLQLVDERTYRTWLLYLAASAINFEDGVTEVHQVLLTPRDAGGRHWLARPF